MTPVSCRCVSRALRWPPARSPSLPEPQTTIAAFLAQQPGRLPYRQVRHWDLRRQWAAGPAGALPNSSSVRSGRSIVGCQSASSQCDPVSPVSVAKRCSRGQLLLIFTPVRTDGVKEGDGFCFLIFLFNAKFHLTCSWSSNQGGFA